MVVNLTILWEAFHDQRSLEGKSLVFNLIILLNLLKAEINY